MWKAHKTIATSAYGLKLEVFPWSVITMAYVVQESTIMWTYVIHKPQKCVDVP